MPEYGVNSCLYPSSEIYCRFKISRGFRQFATEQMDYNCHLGDDVCPVEESERNDSLPRATEPQDNN